MSEKIAEKIPILSNDSVQLDYTIAGNTTPLVDYNLEYTIENHSDTTKPVANNNKEPKNDFEHYAKKAGVTFYGSLIGYALSMAIFLTIFDTLSTIFLLLFGIGMLIGFIFAIISLNRIANAKWEQNKTLRGKFLSITIVIIYSILSILFGLLLLTFGF